MTERFEIEMRKQEKKEADRQEKGSPDAAIHSTANKVSCVSGDKDGELLRRNDYIPLPSRIAQLSRAPFAMQRAAGVSGQKWNERMQTLC